MIGTQFTITNADGDSITLNDHVTDPLRFIALQAYPEMDVDIKNNEIDLQGQHGIWDFFSFYGSRIATFQGVIVGETEADVDAIRTNLIRVLRLPAQPTTTKYGQVTVTFTDPSGDDWQFEAKLFRPIRFTRGMKNVFRLDFNFSLKAADPFLVDQTETTTNGTMGYYTHGGVDVPLTVPFQWAESAQNELTVNNGGVAFAQTIIQLNGHNLGAITNPKVQNLTTGKTFQINTTIADENEYILIDSKEGTVVDQDGVDLTGLVTAASEFLLLQQGDNSIFYTSDESPDVVLYYPTATFSVKHRNTTI